MNDLWAFSASVLFQVVFSFLVVAAPVDSDLIAPQYLLEAAELKDGARIICCTYDLVFEAWIK